MTSGQIGAGGVFRDYCGDWLGEFSANLGRDKLFRQRFGVCLASSSLWTKISLDLLFKRKTKKKNLENFEF